MNRQLSGGVYLFLSLFAMNVFAISPIWDHFYEYQSDNGMTFGDRGNGYRYGWNSSIKENAVDRNSQLSPDERYDRSIAMQQGGSFVWEAEVPNGLYRVLAVAGGPTVTDASYKINAEGVLLVDGTPTAQIPWVSGTALVKVTDGRLTLSNAPGARNNRLAYVNIYSMLHEFPEKPQTEAFPLRIDCGSAPGANGYLPDRIWTKNAPYGYVSLWPESDAVKDFPTVDIGNTDNDRVFQTIRRGEFEYRIRVPDGSNYYVGLLFAELQASGTDRKLLQIKINNQLVTADTIDLVALAGSIKKACVLKLGPVPARDGMLVINFLNRTRNSGPYELTINGLIVHNKPIVDSDSRVPVITQQMSRTSEVVTISGRNIIVSNAKQGDRIGVYDCKGRMVFDRALNSGTLRISSGSFAPGTLMLKLTRNGRAEIWPIIAPR